MRRALRFYPALGFPPRYGGETAIFSGLSAVGHAAGRKGRLLGALRTFSRAV